MQTETTPAERPVSLTTPRQRLLWELATDPTAKVNSRTERTREWLDDHDLLIWDGQAKRYRASTTGWIALLANDQTDTADLWGDLAGFDASDAENLQKARVAFRAWITSQEPEQADPAPEPEVQPAPAQAKAAAKQPTPCACSSYWAGTTVDDEDGGEPQVQDERRTDCTAQTARVFAPGHDAKLVAFLVKAELDGLELHDGFGLSGDAVALTRRHSTLLAAKATKALERGRREAERKTKRAESVKATAAAKPPRQVGAKVVADQTPTADQPANPEPGKARIELTAPKRLRGKTAIAAIGEDGRATYVSTSNGARRARSVVAHPGEYRVIERLDDKPEHDVKVAALQALDAMIKGLNAK